MALNNCPRLCQTSPGTSTGTTAVPQTRPALEKTIVMIQWETMLTLFAVESWDWFLPLTTADTTLIDAFSEKHVDQSPESSQAS